MDTDLFGNQIKINDPDEEGLRRYDKNSFNERLERLKKINQCFPFGQRFFGSDESSRVFDEAIHSYIFGQYITTIILVQAFIERRIQEYFYIRQDEKMAKSSLDKFIKEFKGTGFLPDFLLEKIDKIRLKRNPFVHHRIPLQKDTLMARSFDLGLHPDKLLHNDAIDAITVMFEMAQRSVL
jgi:hypothetical protein